MSSVLYEWQTLGHRYRLCPAGTRIPGWLELGPDAARWLLAAQLGGRWMVPANLGDHRALERDVAQRRLVVLERSLAAIVLAGAARPPAPAPGLESEPRGERGWIDVTIVDDSEPARPLAGAGFRLQLPDGSTLAGTLDAAGRLRVDDVEPGRCRLELGDLVHRP